ncbi:MAG: hypothetical protein K8J08_21755 [Thermoanaerobaculia bacterium]|nr:hypothetical protein [Thermoanaerobaculia bacterium]
MGKVILGVVLGYITMAILVMLSLTLVWLALGSEQVFVEGSNQVTSLWSVLTLVEGFFAAIFGGWICARVAGGSARNAVRALAGLVLILGIVSGVMTLRSADDPNLATTLSKSGSEMSFMEAGREGRQLTWYLLGLPWVGAFGVLLGGSIHTRKLPR